MPKTDVIYWLWLSLTLKTGSMLPNTLLKYFGTPEKIFSCTKEDLDAIDTNFYGHKEDLLDKDLSKARDVLEYCRENDVGIMTPDDEFYPTKFRLIQNKPIVLYYLGNFLDLDSSFCVGVVGTRIPSNYGTHAAKRISFDLAKSGAVIVSGVAMGVDAVSHRAALFAGKKTVGILGCGIDRVYPKENAELYEEIIKNGLLITEFPPSSPPEAGHFPIRNRLISALSDAVCVIEGSETSGTLITAEYAFNYGKSVYSVPGSIFAQCSAGSNFLLKIGAKPLLSAFDVINDFKHKYKFLLDEVGEFENGKKPEKEKTPKKAIKKKIENYVFDGMKRVGKKKEPIPPKFDFVEISSLEEGEEDKTKNAETVRSENLISLKDDERELYSRISFDPIFPDSLVSDKYKISQIMVILTKLEIKGLVKKCAGGRFVLSDRAEN